MAKKEMVWDLSQLVEDTDPTFLEKQMDKAVQESEKFREGFRRLIEGMDARNIVEFLERYEELQMEYEGVFDYCRLNYQADMTDATAKKLYDQAQTKGTEIQKNLAFVELELGRLLKTQKNIIRRKEVEEYRQYLANIHRKTPYMLPEDQEKIILAKDRNGIRAWQQLQGDWLSTRMFEIEIDGEKKEMPYGKIISLYEDSRRDVRKEANKVVYEGLGQDDIIWASAIRSVSSDHIEMCKVRGYPDSMTQSLIANDVVKETINALIDTILENVDVYRRYLKLKAKAMGLDKLGNWDIVAPLPDAPEKKYDWSEARDLITRAYGNFDSEVADWISDMYERNHIDGEVRKGKRSGAFCSTWFSGQSAYILQSYNGTMGDVFTQAHELGHAVHAYLGSRNQTLLNYRIGSCIAETGSIFGELLLTEKLLEESDSDEAKRAVLAQVLDEFGMAAFQVSARVLFEKSMYDAIQKGELLDGEKVSALWVKARDTIYGDAVEWLDSMQWEWTMKIHYYIPNYRFYNYPYVFAQLFVYAMYRLYKVLGDEFVPRFKGLLAAGSSKPPRLLAEDLGLDITKEDFWQKGIDQFEKFIDMFEETLE